MKNKTGLMIVVIAALSGLVWGDLPVTEDVAELIEKTGKMAPAEIPVDPGPDMPLDQKPKRSEFYKKILQSYEMAVETAKSETVTPEQIETSVEKAVIEALKQLPKPAPPKEEHISMAEHEAMITTTKDYFFDTTNKILWVTGGIVTITLALAGFLMPYLLEKRRDDLNKSLLENLEIQLQSYSKEQADEAKKKSEKSLIIAMDVIQKEFEKSEKKLSDDINSKTADLSRRIFEEQASRQVERAHSAYKDDYLITALMFYLTGIGNFLAAKNFEKAMLWFNRTILTARKVVHSKMSTLDVSYEQIKYQLSIIKGHLSIQPDQLEIFDPKLSELSGIIEKIEEHVVSFDLVEPTQQTPDDPSG